jgi:hypothetical protein
MTDAFLEEFVHILRRQVNASSDPRVGSARDNSTSTSPLKVTTGTNSASFATFFVTLVPILIYAVICVLIFLCLRKRCPRVYSPRTFLTSLQPDQRSKELPNGWFNWFMPFWRTPDEDVLNHSSLDGFLFLRFLKILCVICFVGLLISWPILLPINTYGGAGNQQLDKLTFGNITKPSWCYAHAMIAWLYFGFILYMVSRESVYFINLRQAHLLAPHYSDRLSSRTVLFTCAESFVSKYPALVTGFFFFAWYFLNVIFNIMNKKLYNYFPYPYFVSAIHLGVGVAYCCVSWLLGVPKRAPIDGELFKLLLPVSVCHALGHVMTNVSFAAVAVSFTHTIKALEPFFNAAASQFILGQQIPVTLWLTLAPIVLGKSIGFNI